MNIEIWSDIACPYCYIGFIRLQNAIDAFAHKAQVKIILRSFELEPGIAANSGESQLQAVIRKYKQSPAGARHILDQASEHAIQTGLEINWDKVYTTNTFDAHRLVHFAAESGSALNMKRILFEAYFRDGKNISNLATLTELAKTNHLDATALFASNRYTGAIRQDEREARLLGIRSVPYYLIDEKTGLTGAQSQAVFSTALQQQWEKLPSPGKRSDSDDNGSRDGACNI